MDPKPEEVPVGHYLHQSSLDQEIQKAMRGKSSFSRKDQIYTLSLIYQCWYETCLVIDKSLK